MTTHTTGTKYEATRDIGRTAVAKLIRADIAAAIETGDLPAGLKVSVRAIRVTHSSGINLTVTAVPAGFPVRVHDEKLVEERRAARIPKPWYTRQAYNVLEELERIAAAYNQEHSDFQSDYYSARFYLTVAFACEVEHPGEKAA